ncbi:MAG: hypothetical protein ACPLXO_02965 [Desulfurella sp.]
MIYITIDENTDKQYYAEILEKYQQLVFNEAPPAKIIHFKAMIKTATDLYMRKKYTDALEIFLSVYKEITDNRYMVSRNMITALANNIANCYVKLQEEQEYKNYFLLTRAEEFYKKAIKYAGAFHRAKGLVFFNYGFFILKLQVWKENPHDLINPNNNTIRLVNTYTYTNKRSLLMYKLFILAQKYRFFNDISPKVIINLGIRLF